MKMEAIARLFRNYNFKLKFIAHDNTVAIVKFRYHSLSENSKTNSRNNPMTLALEAILEMKKSADVEIISYWIAHNEETAKGLIHTSSAMLVDPISNYYGPDVATYFAWLQYYQTTLRFPCLAGVILFAQELYFNTTQLTMIPFFGVALALWSTVFVQFWKRRNASLRMAWGIDASEQLLDAEAVTVRHVTDYYFVFDIRMLCRL